MTSTFFSDLVLRDVTGNKPSPGIVGRLFYDTTLAKLERDNGSVWEDCEPVYTIPSAAIYPQMANVMGHMFVKTTGASTIFNQYDASQLYANYAYTLSPANGDVITASIMLKSGTYNWGVDTVKKNSFGKLDFSMDGVNFSTANDLYSSSTVYNNWLTGTITIAANGRHLLKITVNGKNGSSSGYGLGLTVFAFSAQTMTTEV